MNLFRTLPLLFWPACRVLAAAGLFVFGGLGFAQSSLPQGNQRIPDFRAIDQEEGARRLDAFRRQRLEGDYFFRFDLVHLPRRGDPLACDGLMWGSWNDQGPVSRVLLWMPETSGGASPQGPLELIAQNGPRPQAWIRRGGIGPFRELRGEERFQPLLPGINYSAFDLQMPFVFWENSTYEGPGKALGRAAQRFLMSPPPGGSAAAAGVGAVRLVLDENYNALLRVDVIDPGDREISSFRVRKFKQVQEQWIVRAVDLLNNRDRSRTRFEVTAAAAGIELDPCIFKPDTTAAPPAAPDVALENF